MVDALEIADSLCLGYEKRTSEQPVQGVFEWQFAETAAYFYFRKFFLDTFSGGFVLGQLDYKTADTARLGDPTIQSVLDAMRIHFRNWWSRTNYSREGGFRKPDGFGIAPNATQIWIIEVKPWNRANDGVTQLQEMITITGNAISDYYKEQSINQSPMLNPDFVTVKGAPWKPRGGQLVYPLPYGVQNSEIAWICFKPTIRSTSLADGVILYEIHTMQKDKYRDYVKRLPEDMKQRLREAHAERMRARTSLNLTPWANNFASANARDAAMMRDLTLMVGIIAAVAIVAGAILIAPEVLALVGPAASETLVGGTTVEVLVGGSYRVAPTLVRVSMAEYEAMQSANALVRVAEGTETLVRIAEAEELTEIAEGAEEIGRMSSGY
ncbi:MAG TPA: hypothetical protein VKP67_19880 [Xanthobacteraceae bacterium]|nr:hypothetical protein [Xanthobacteraceae bacterium]